MREFYSARVRGGNAVNFLRRRRPVYRNWREKLKSIQIDRYGGPAVLMHREIATPVPGAGDVLIRISHAGINFMDIHTREGKYANSRTYTVGLPCTLGMEGAGRVAAVGTDV